MNVWSGYKGWFSKCWLFLMVKIFAKQNFCQDELSLSIWQNVLVVRITIRSILSEVARLTPSSSIFSKTRVEAWFVDNNWRNFVRTVPKQLSFRISIKLLFQFRQSSVVVIPNIQLLRDFYLCDNSCWNCFVQDLLYLDKRRIILVHFIHNTAFFFQNNLLYSIDPVFRHV